MAHSHVPKFGDWDNDNLPYTTYFENARKEKAGIRMNPNDPEENPEAFMYMRAGLESNYDCQPVQVYLAVDSSQPNSADKHRTDGQSSQNAATRNGSYDYQKSARRQQRSMASESGSEKSNSDRSVVHSNHRRTNSGQNKGRAGGSSFSSSVSRQSQRNGNYQFDGNKHHRTASVPKFGEWDETDPTSGEGFTAIFNEVKEEKRAPSSNFPTVPTPQPSKRPSPSWCSKICCGLFSRGSE